LHDARWNFALSLFERRSRWDCQKRWRKEPEFKPFKLDRLSRSLKDLLNILERVSAAGAKFRSLTESIDTSGPAGRMLMQMVGSFAEFEREMIRERTRAGLHESPAR
jgi:Resolvase, N terminal domain